MNREFHHIAIILIVISALLNSPICAEHATSREIEDMMTRLVSDNPTDQVSAKNALQNLASEDATLLLPYTDSHDARIRAKAINHILLNDPANWPVILKALKNNEPGSAGLAVRTLLNNNIAVDDDQKTSLTRMLARIVQQAPFPRISCLALAKYADSSSLSMLREKRGEVLKEEARQKIAVNPTLMKSSDFIQVAMAQLGDEAAYQSIMNDLRDAGSPTLAIRHITKLGHIQDMRSIPYIAKWLDDDNLYRDQDVLFGIPAKLAAETIHKILAQAGNPPTHESFTLEPRDYPQSINNARDWWHANKEMFHDELTKQH